MDKQKMKLLIIFFNIWIFLSCNNQERKYNELGRPISKDPFYTVSTDFDLTRFPLIKPYEVISIDDGKHWSVRSIAQQNGIDEASDINSIDSIAYLKNHFLVYSNGFTIVQGKSVNEAWYIIILNDSTIKSFTVKNDFYKFLNKNDIKNFKWKSPQFLYKLFDETYCLPWIKECQ